MKNSLFHNLVKSRLSFIYQIQKPLTAFLQIPPLPFAIITKIFKLYTVSVFYKANISRECLRILQRIFIQAHA